jgi:aspartyl-tRNA(Asn)/glutamyl-tRNA(Gln) amidotransferase subunit A
VADAALVMSVLAGPDQRDRFSLPSLPDDIWDLKKKQPSPPRLSWCAAPTGTPVDPEVAELCLRAAQLLAKETGGRLTEHKGPLIPRDEAKGLLKHLTVAFAVGALGEFRAYTAHRDRKAFDKVKPDLSPSFVRLVEPAWGTTLDEYAAAQAENTSFSEGRGAALFDRHDLILTPTIAVPPFDKTLDCGPETINGERIGDHLEWHLSWPFNLTGDPAVSVPCGWTRAGLPVGLQIAGRRGQDGLVLRAAAAVEKLVKRPPLPEALEKLARPTGK